MRMGKSLFLYMLVTNGGVALLRSRMRSGDAADWARWAAALLVLAAVIALIRVWSRENGLGWKELGVFPAPRAGGLLLGIGAAVLSVWAGRLIAKVSSLDVAANRAPVAALLPDPSAKGQLAALLLVYAAVEELFFRGFLLAALRKRYGGTVAVAASTLLFAAYHMSLSNAPHHLAMGVICGSVTAATGSIYPALIAHWLHNTRALLG